MKLIRIFAQGYTMRKYAIIVLLILLTPAGILAQKGWALGGCGIYNITTADKGIGARALIPVHKNLYAVPYTFYIFNTREFSGGLAAMVPFYKYGMFSFYALASATLRAEISVTVNDSTTSQKTSREADGEAGLGVLIGDGCLKGMVEPRYAVGQKEFVFRAGLVYFLSCKTKKRSSGQKKKGWQPGNYSNVYQRAYCPAYH
jgi:hypothetical protein